MDLDALREALTQHRDGVAGVHQYDELAIAARAVLDSEEVTWCEEHQSRVYLNEAMNPKDHCVTWENWWLRKMNMDAIPGCSIEPVTVVRRLLTEEPK